MHTAILVSAIALAAAPAVLAEHVDHASFPNKKPHFQRVKRGGATLHLFGDETIAFWSGGSAPKPPAIQSVAVSPTPTYTNVIQSMNARLGVPASLNTQSVYPKPSMQARSELNEDEENVNLEARSELNEDEENVNLMDQILALSEPEPTATPVAVTRKRYRRSVNLDVEDPNPLHGREVVDEAEDEESNLFARGNAPSSSVLSTVSNSTSIAKSSTSSSSVAKLPSSSSSSERKTSSSSVESKSSSKPSSSSKAASTSAESKSSSKPSSSSKATSSSSASSRSVASTTSGSSKVTSKSASSTSAKASTVPVAAFAAVDPSVQGIGQGWGSSLADKYTSMTVMNHGTQGASSRSYYRDLWKSALESIKAGDIVVLEFGHYDNLVPGSVADSAAGCVGTVSGYGSQTVSVTSCSGAQEVVLTFNGYLEKMCGDVKAKGATCVISSITPRNQWKRDNTVTFVSQYVNFAKQAAGAIGAVYVPHEESAVKSLIAIGQTPAATLFLPSQDLITNAGGASVMAQAFVAAAYCAGANALTAVFTPSAQALKGTLC